MLKTDVVIVTARGRHEWICEELSRLGLTAVVLDVTEALGVWAPEDGEGPFGVLKSERISETQMATLMRDAEVSHIDQGVVLWPRSGPFELKGALSAFQFKNLNLDSVVRDYIAASENTYRQKALEDERHEILNSEYKNVWLAHFAHHFASPMDKTFPESVRTAHALPLFAPYRFRKPHRRSSAQHKKALEVMGHFYHSTRKILSVESSSRQLQAIECETVSVEDSAVKTQKFEANYFVWDLSRHETEFLGSSLSKELFVTPVVEPLWTWTRFRFHFKPSRLLEIMPDVVFLIDDLFLSWTHENFLGLVRADKAWDVWVKVAFHRRQDKSYLQTLGVLIESQLKERVAGAVVTHIEYPQYFHYEDLAPLPFSVYEEKGFEGLRRVRHQNFYFGGEEAQENLDWTGFFERQNQIVENIITDVVRSRENLQKRISYSPEELP